MNELEFWRIVFVKEPQLVPPYRAPDSEGGDAIAKCRSGAGRRGGEATQIELEGSEGRGCGGDDGNIINQTLNTRQTLDPLHTPLSLE